MLAFLSAWWAAESKLHKGAGEQMLWSEQAALEVFYTGKWWSVTPRHGLIDKLKEIETWHTG